MTRYVAFLRAINTPPRHVKMAALRAVFVGLGFENVATYIASGNVIFDTSDAVDPARIEAALEAALGFDVPVMLRTGPEVVAAADRPVPPEMDVEVSFLARFPDPAAAAEVEASAAPTEVVRIVGRELYWARAGPRDAPGYGDASATRTLGMAITQRSLRTVRAIADRFLRSG